MIAPGDLVVSPWRARHRRVAHLVVEILATEAYRYRLRCGYAMNDPQPAQADEEAPLCRYCHPAPRRRLPGPEGASR